LRRLAGGVARGFGAQSDLADELVSEFLLELALSKQGAAYRELASSDQADEAVLRAHVSRRLRQIAVSMRPRWKLFRALHLHVKAVLADGPAASSGALPASLTHGRSGRLSRAFVAEAVAWAVARADSGVAGTANSASITRLLLDTYSPLPQSLHALPDQLELKADPEKQAHRSVSGERLLRSLEGMVAPHELEAMVLLSEGHTLAEVAERFGVSVPTAHAWKETVVDTLRRMTTERHTTAGTLRTMMARARHELYMRRRSDSGKS